MEIITYPEATAKRLGQINLNTDTGVFGPTKRVGKLIDLEKGTKLTGDSIQNLTSPELNGQIVEL